MGHLYCVSVEYTTVDNSPQEDILWVQPATDTPVVLHEWSMQPVPYGQTDIQDANEEMRRWEIETGYGGSAGTVQTPAPLHPDSPVALATVKSNVGSYTSGSGTYGVIDSGAFNIRDGGTRLWTPRSRPVLKQATRTLFRFYVGADSFTMSWSLVFEEL